MAGITVITAIDMRIALATGGGSIVTTNTGTDDLRMINISRCHWRPGRRERRMTGITRICGINVSVTFTTGIGAVVTTDTVT